jgi:hypothetical protein
MDETKDDLGRGWLPEVEELRLRTSLAAQMGGEEIEKRLSKVTSPFLTAEMFGIEEIIDPRDTRPLLCEWVEAAYRLLPSELRAKKRRMRP